MGDQVGVHLARRDLVEDRTLHIRHAGDGGDDAIEVLPAYQLAEWGPVLARRGMGRQDGCAHVRREQRVEQHVEVGLSEDTAQ